MYPDVCEAGVDAARHYVEYGAAEARNPSPHFDGNYYLDQHPDVRRAGQNPLVHYLTHGLVEGRRSRSIFDALFGDQASRAAVTVTPTESPSAMAPRGVSRRFGVNFFGPVTIASGLGSAGRGYLAALARAKVLTRVVPIVEGFQHQRQLQYPIAAPSKEPFALTLMHLNADTTSLALRLFPEEFSEHRYRIGLWVWELAALPAGWHSYIQCYDEIWVPSNFCQRAVAAQTCRPVVVTPYLVENNSPLDRSLRQEMGFQEDTFVFLYMFDASSYLSRKNPELLLEAFVDEFGDNPNVALLLKVSYTDYAGPEFNVFSRRCIGRPNVIIIEDVVEQGGVARLIDAADCYVSPHRSEGFGLTIAEAMSRGRPVIATDYSGPSDYLSEANGYPLGYKLVEITQDLGPYANGHVWADPNKRHLQTLMRRVATHREEALAKGAAALQTIKKRFSEAAVSTILQARLQQVWPLRGVPFRWPSVRGRAKHSFALF